MNVSSVQRWLVLGVLVVLGVNLKLRLSTNSPRFDPEDETAYFRTESAFQYRYARLAAAGKPLPEVDKEAQWPEGVKPHRELTSLMERLTGWSYRLLAPGSDFRWYVLVWTAVVSSLAMIPFYLLSGSLAATAAYGLSWAAQSNVIGSFRLEALGLPLIFASLACTGPLAGVFVFLAFAAWHLTRFYVATFLLATGYAYWRRRDRALVRTAAWVLLGTAAAFLLLPSARESTYGHVYGLLWAKLAHFLQHPADPSLLTPVQRLEWTGPSNSPDLGFLIFAFVPLAFVLMPLRKAEKDARGPLFDALAVIYAVGTILSSRLTPWLAFFLVLAAARRADRRVLIAVAALEAFKCFAPYSPFNPILRLSAPFSQPVLRPGVSLRSEKQLLGWLRRYGGPDRPVLAPMGVSAEVLAYSGTPVLLQPKWEASAIREKTAEFAQVLFADEAAFAAYCEKYGAKLYVHGADVVLDGTPEGLRYASARPLREDSAAYLFQFEPEKLKRFSLVFQNEDYRVYSTEKIPVSKIPKVAVWDRAQYGQPLDTDGVLKRMEQARMKLVLARVMTRLGRREEALANYADSFAAWPADPDVLDEYNRLRR